MSTLDLFPMARETADHLASECAMHVGAIVEFSRSVEREGRFSVTMKFARIHSFMDGGRYLNPWEECSRDAEGDEAKATQLMVERQKGWYGRRALFEGSFEHGKKFQYGALYTSGRALVHSKYGPFCAVFGSEAALSWHSIAWLRDNSLQRYVPDNDTFDVELLRREVGPHESRHYIAALKHAADIEAWPPEGWSTMLCGGDRFVEGIVVDDLLPEQIERLLADHDTWTDMLRANTAFLAGRADAVQCVKASQYRALKSTMKRQNVTITWEKV